VKGKKNEPAEMRKPAIAQSTGEIEKFSADGMRCGAVIYAIRKLNTAML